MTNGSNPKPGHITVEAIKLAAGHPFLTLMYILPPAVIPYAGLKQVLVLSLSLAALVVRCGVYGSFTAPGRGETATGAGLFVRSIGRFIFRFISLGLLIGIPFATVAAVIVYYVGTPENLSPIIVAVGYPVMSLGTMALGVMFRRDTGVFDTVGKTVTYIARLWPVFVILGIGTAFSLIGKYHLFRHVVPVGIGSDPLLSVNYLISSFCEVPVRIGIHRPGGGRGSRSRRRGCVNARRLTRNTGCLCRL